ncbi:galactose mutarotase [Litoribacter ruber]|uniref:aldose epimerase family protein n=1 Tax=Litoribacter ruber TaxID=702568 RepID=UPI001BD927BC|nr:aldose epimerase family protein [Litoribacter ruber]MBT0811899.1 galactose mutarotase [Litoribacter ruber]
MNLYKLKNSNGMEIHVTNYGGRVVKLLAPDKEGQLLDVVLGFDDLQDYKKSSEAYFGAVIGRFANRIAKGKFTLDGEEFTLDQNNGPNSLHGGAKGFHHADWEVLSADTEHVAFRYLSADGEEGFPGNLEVNMVYTLTEEDAFRIDYEATTDQKTVVNLSHHSFFNLNGAGEGDVLDHQLEINANAFTPVDETQIPTGEITLVKDSPFDFHSPRVIGERIKDDHVQLKFGKGYDHNWVLNRPEPGLLEYAAGIWSERSGIKMEVFTTQPGIQFYTSNFLDGRVKGKGGKTYPKHSAFCLETQHFPDSPNHSYFPSTVLEKREVYRETCVYKFSTLE